MARRTGWRLRKRGDTYSVRFRVGSERFEIATGARDLVGATRRAEAIYADAIAGRLKERTRFRLAADTPLEEVAALWLADMEAEVDAETVGLWKSYVRAHWRQHFGRLVDLTESNMAAYGRARLRAVLAVTARKELSALRRFVRWLAEQEHVSAPPVVPSLAKGAIGTRFEKRRRGQPTEISAEEARAIVAALPERSRKHGHIVRARFVVAYETALRPATLDALSVPEHYRRGADALRIAAEIDKARYGRQVPLSPAARAALDAVCPERGLLFGRHDHRDQLERAARRVLDETRAATFTAYDLRHCRLTELAETGNVTGAAYLAGHRRISTTAIYARPNRAAATRLLESLGAIAGGKPLLEQVGQGAPIANPATFLRCEGEDLNLHGSYPASTSREQGRDAAAKNGSETRGEGLREALAFTPGGAVPPANDVAIAFAVGEAIGFLRGVGAIGAAA